MLLTFCPSPLVLDGPAKGKVEIDSMSSLLGKLPSVIEIKKTRSVVKRPPIVAILAKGFHSGTQSDISLMSNKSLAQM